MRYAIIDIGSNSIRLLIAAYSRRSGIRTLVSRVAASRLLGDTPELTAIPEDRISATIAIIKKYTKEITRYRVSRRILFATYSLRHAANRDEVKSRFENAAGVPVRIITGAEESVFGLQAVMHFHAHRFSQDDIAAVIDAGGGSTEISLVQYRGKGSYRLLFQQSFSGGAVSLKNKFITGYPVEGKALAALRRSIKKELQLPPIHPAHCIAMGGTVTTLGAVVSGMTVYDPELIERIELTRGKLSRLSALMEYMTAEDIGVLPGVPASRRDILFPGLQIYLALIEKLNARRIYISDKGPLYGALLEAVEL